MSPPTTAAAPANRAGYRHGLRQPAMKVTLRVQLPAGIDFAHLDDWVDKAFAGQVPPLEDAALEVVPARAFALRVMRLAAVLLRAIRVPVFAAGAVVEAHEGTGGVWTVQAGFPRVDHVQRQLFDLAHEMAGKALAWMVGRERTAASLDQLFGVLDSGFVQKFTGAVGGGDSTVPLLQTAFEMDLPFRHLAAAVYQVGWGSAACRIDRGSIHFDSAIGARMVQDKSIAASVLRDAGLPGPVHQRVSSEPEALSAAHALGWPVVVKPVDRDRGEGVTVDVDSGEKLAAAFAHAAQCSKFLLVERQVPGICHRIVVVRDKVIMVSRRLPKSVWGDGEHTVAQLVAMANAIELAKPPWQRLKPFPLDAAAIESLAAAKLAPDSVPAKGQLAPLRRIQSSQDGGVVDYFNDTIHPENVEVAVRSARLFGLTLAGVDMISTDITRPWHENGAILNEVNFSSLLPGRLSRETLPGLLRQFVAADARIPVELVLGEGDSARAEGERRRDELARRGLRVHVATAESTMGPGGAVSFAGQGLFARCIALSLDSNVDAIVIVVQSDEFLKTGLPFDRFSRITVAPGASASWIEATQALAAPYLATESM